MKSDIDSTVSSLMVQHKDIFVCPACCGTLNESVDHRSIGCSNCGKSFRCENGIPLLFWPNEWDSETDVTEIVKSFYEENPFPGYEEVDSSYRLREKAEKGVFARSLYEESTSSYRLREKAEKGVFARLLDDQIPHGARILEAGCGTGQLSNFLATKGGRTVFGTDICLNSLRLGHGFKEKNQIDNVAFFQINLFRPIFRPESFHVVICNGVLHHTG